MINIQIVCSHLINNIIFFNLTILIIIQLLLSRIYFKDALNNELRNNIYITIKNNPNIHFREIMRKLSIKPGTLSYHLRILEKNGYIKSIQKGEYRCFYSDDDKSDLKIILSELQQKILYIIYEKPGITLTELSKSTGKNKMVLNYNTHVLQDFGIIRQENVGRIKTYHVTTKADSYISLTLLH